MQCKAIFFFAQLDTQHAIINNRKCKCKTAIMFSVLNSIGCWQVGAVTNIANGVGGQGFNSQACQIQHNRQRLTTAAKILWSCVAKMVSYKNQPRH